MNEKQDMQHLERLTGKFNHLAETNRNILLINSLKNIDSFLNSYQNQAYQLQSNYPNQQLYNGGQSYY